MDPPADQGSERRPEDEVPEALFDPDDPQDAAIAWEFGLWRKAEAARLEAELAKLEAQRLEEIRAAHSAAMSALWERHKGRLSACDDIEASLAADAAKTQAKAQEYRQQRQSMAAELAEVKAYLAKQVGEAEAVAAEGRAEADSLVAAEAARAEQMAAQAAFFQGEWKAAERRRAEEGAAFTDFLQKTEDGPAARARKEAVQRERELSAARERVHELSADLDALTRSLQAKMDKIRELKARLAARTLGGH